MSMKVFCSKPPNKIALPQVWAKARFTGISPWANFWASLSQGRGAEERWPERTSSEHDQARSDGDAQRCYALNCSEHGSNRYRRLGANEDSARRWTHTQGPDRYERSGWCELTDGTGAMGHRESLEGTRSPRDLIAMSDRDGGSELARIWECPQRSCEGARI
jgi:hypothetical protein